MQSDDAQIVGSEGRSGVIAGEVTLKSIVESLASKGFDLGPEQRLSYQDPVKSLNIFIGKACDEALIGTFKLPSSAFQLTDGDGTPQLTLQIREPGSATKAHIQADSSSMRQQHFADDSETARDELAQQSRFAKQTHDLLASQSFARATGIDAVNPADLSDGITDVSQGKTAGASAVGNAYAMDPADLKRTKERQIRFVVERVSLWRKLYNGVELGNGETVRYSLEDSAKLVGISKKSLDDYLLQLRFGRMYGFDFLKHQCANIGVLRKFVREHKNKQRKQQQQPAQKASKNESSTGSEGRSSLKKKKIIAADDNDDDEVAAGDEADCPDQAIKDESSA